MTNEIVYSIIIPHKNIPHLLRRCLASIPVRQDTEIIIVDDNSDENIVDFNNFPGSDRSDVSIIFDKSGLRAGHARNIGIDHSHGEKILFVDADDFLYFCIGDVLDEYKNKDFDIAYFNANSLDGESYLPAHRSDQLNTFIANALNKKKEKGLAQLRYIFGEPWCRIVSKKFLDQHSIRFAETIIHNDTEFGYLSGFHAKRVLVDNRAIYCVTTRQGSTSLANDRKRGLTRIDVFAKKENFLKTHGISAEEPYLTWQLAILLLFDREAYTMGVEIAKKYGVWTFKNKVRLLWQILKQIYHLIRGHKTWV